jgi:1-acyl-sn-glycerol-3-phosphate acyltransferase
MQSNQPPIVPAWFQNGFHRFLKPYLQRHFHAIAIERESLATAQIEVNLPLIVYGNHPSWWDPLIAHFLNRTLFPGRQFYAPIDAVALEQYQVFAKLGFFGVDLASTAGAGTFLKQCAAILQSQGTAIWITPEGRFADVRDQQAELMPGLAHLCCKQAQGVVLPVALEYLFWDERLPVCLVKLGKPIQIANHREVSKPVWNELVTTRLRQTQAELAQLAMARSSQPFENLLLGKTGAGGTYDIFRRLKSLATGRRFRAKHGKQFE